jgi:hypothetical protein
MGEVGAGKSTVRLSKSFVQKHGIERQSQFINTAADGTLAIVGHDLDPCTSKVEHFAIHRNERTVFLVDTPGFNHPTKADGDILKGIVNWVEKK